jgi:hypothetical protein
MFSIVSSSAIDLAISIETPLHCRRLRQNIIPRNRLMLLSICYGGRRCKSQTQISIAPIVRSESEFRDMGVSDEKEGPPPPLPFRQRPYKVKKIDQNGNKSAKIVQYRKTNRLKRPKQVIFERFLDSQALKRLKNILLYNFLQKIFLVRSKNGSPPPFHQGFPKIPYSLSPPPGR